MCHGAEGSEKFLAASAAQPHRASNISILNCTQKGLGLFTFGSYLRAAIGPIAGATVGQPP